MPLIPFARLLFSLASLALLGLAAYLLWSWHAGAFVFDADGDPVRVREQWRLWAGLGLVAWSFVGRLPVLWLIAGPDREAPTRPVRDQGVIIDGIDGARLYVEAHGPSGAPTLVLTHGWGLDSTIWRYARRELEGRFRIVVWDLPSLGKSRGDISLDAFARNLEQVVRWADAPVVLVGHSIGGMTIQTLFLQTRGAVDDRICGVVLLNTTYTNPLKTMILSPLMQALRRPLLDPVLRLAIVLQPLVWIGAWQGYLSGSAHLANRIGFGRHVTRSQLDHNTLLATRNPPGASARGNLAMFAWDATGAMAAGAVPVLVVTGQADIVTRPSAGEAIAAVAPNAQRLQIEGVNHMGFLERHGDYNAAIASFSASAFAARATPSDAPAI
jgi:pimeloyl-ACP methyl ester carboxylesterase